MFGLAPTVYGNLENGIIIVIVVHFVMWIATYLGVEISIIFFLKIFFLVIIVFTFMLFFVMKYLMRTTAHNSVSDLVKISFNLLI